MRTTALKTSAFCLLASSHAYFQLLLHADATVALSNGDAQSLAKFLRGLVRSTATRGGPEQGCLKNAFRLMGSRWKMKMGGSNPSVLSGQKNPSVEFGESFFLSPELFANVVDFLERTSAKSVQQVGGGGARLSALCGPIR